MKWYKIIVENKTLRLCVLCAFAFNKKALALENQTQRRKERKDAKFYFLQR